MPLPWYRFTLRQLVTLIYWCAICLVMFREVRAKDLPEAIGIFVVAYLVGRFWIPNIKTTCFSRSHVPQDPCGPIIWRGLDEPSEKIHP